MKGFPNSGVKSGVTCSQSSYMNKKDYVVYSKGHDESCTEPEWIGSGDFCSLIHPSSFLIIPCAPGMPGMTIVRRMFMHGEAFQNYRL